MANQQNSFLNNIRLALGRSESQLSRPEPLSGYTALEEQERIVSEQFQKTKIMRSELTNTLIKEGRKAALEADLGITEAEYAIAETGTIALLPRTGLNRLTSLTLLIRLAIVQASAIIQSLVDSLALRHLAVLRGEDLGSSMNLMSGPNRTRDIEQTITIGVHDPKEVHMIVLEQDE